MTFEGSGRKREKRASRREERIYSGRWEKAEHPAPDLIDLHADLEPIRQHMVEAAKEAIEDAEATRARYKAENGELRSQSGGHYLYSFRLRSYWEPKDDTPVKIQTDPSDPKSTIDGTLIEADGAAIILATPVPLPAQALQSITVFENTSWLLQQVLQELTNLRETPAQMGAKTFGVLESSEGKESPETLSEKIGKFGSFAADDDQRKALWRGLSCEILRLIGPPGAGKTKTLAGLAWSYLRQGLKVLLVAHTNVAVDNAVSSQIELCYDTGCGYWLKAHRIVRTGNSKDLGAGSYRDVLHDSIVDQELGELAASRDALKQENSLLAEEQTQLADELARKKREWKSQRRSIAHHLEEANTRRREVKARIEERRASLEQEIKARRQERTSARLALVPLEISERRLTEQYQGMEQSRRILHQEVTDVEREIALVRGMNWLQRLIYILKRIRSPEEIARRSQILGEKISEAFDLEEEQSYARRLRENISRLDQALRGLQDELNAARLDKRGPWAIIQRTDEQEAELLKMLTEHPNTYLRNLDAQHQQECDRLAAELQGGDHKIDGIEYRLDLLRDRRNEIGERLREIEQESRQIKERVIAQADLVATTLTGVYTNPYLQGRYYDCVIIDEASMASLLVILIAAARATAHVNIIGDPLQLAPISGLNEERKYPIARKWLGTDLFTFLGITLEQAERGEKKTVFLQQQSRMDPDISLPVSTYIYGGRLKDRPRPGYVRQALEPLPERAWLVVDTGDEPGCQFERPSSGRSKYNEYHIRCDMQLVQRFLDSRPELMGASYPTIGIITPYAPQARKIRAALAERGWDRYVRAGTIHAFEGREFVAVILDFVEAPPASKSENPALPRFVSDVWGHKGIAAPATRLVNVGHSRAREKLVYVANVQYHLAHSSEQHVLTKFILDGVASGRIASHDLWW